MSVYLTHGADGAVLYELIGAADAMNHAIPTRGELSRSLTRLATHGVLREIDGKYKIVDEHLPEIAKASAGKGGLFSTPDKGKDWLTRTAPAATEEVVVEVSDSQLAVAYKRYRERLKKR